MPREKSPHILAASANLVGLTLVILSLLKPLNLPQVVLISKTASIGTALFSLSCVFSFMSIRSVGRERRAFIYESIADYLFFAGILLLSCIGVLIAFDELWL